MWNIYNDWQYIIKNPRSIIKFAHKEFAIKGLGIVL